jgi:hypothetical protein
MQKEDRPYGHEALVTGPKGGRIMVHENIKDAAHGSSVQLNEEMIAQDEFQGQGRDCLRQNGEMPFVTSSSLRRVHRGS